MSTLEQWALVVVSLWLAVLTFVVLALVRQLGLVVVRLRTGETRIDLDGDGPEIGSLATLASLPSGALTGDHVLVIMSATCAPCRDLSLGLRRIESEIPSGVLVMLAGESTLAQAMAGLLPSNVEVFFDPVAQATADALNVSTTPFALDLSDTRVEGKAYLFEATDLIRLAEGRQRRSVQDRRQEVEVR